MPDRDTFLRTIRERPDDDGPRLVYADWLEERGDPRGEFIRIQCELAKLPPWAPRRPTLEEREADLLAAHDYEWLGKPPRWVTHGSFARGFVDRLTVTRPTLHELDDVLAESIRPNVAFAVPTPERASRHDLAGLMHSARLGELGGLEWRESLDALQHFRALRDVLRDKRLSELKQLSTHGTWARDNWLEHLSHRPGAENLRELELDSLEVGGARAFFEYRGLNNVDSIAFSREVAEQFVQVVPEEPFRWRKLDFGFSGFSLEDITALAECQRLTELHLHWTQREPIPLPAALRRLHLNALAVPEFRNLPAIEWLHLRIDSGDPRNPQDDSRALGELLQRLRGPVVHLETYGHRIPFGELGRLPAKDRVRRLVFDCDEVSDAEVKAFVEFGHFPRLQALHLRSPRFTSRHIEMLATMPFPPSLRRMSINSRLVSDAASAALLRSPYLQRLMLINLRECHVGPQTFAALAESPGLPRLRELILPLGGELTEDDIRSFRQTPGLSPLCRVQRR